ncbi:2'-5' RNA ligase family protein [Streptomyces sp. NPDC087532]|uniref:2'-5' RNA ligase family protein n=1 Tax=Streptomyces sp. NPDC087532 TaxID=3365795 RepID=UPI00381806CC
MKLQADASVFPSTPPSSLDDPKAIADNDWSAFSAVTNMTNHWNRRGWSDHSRFYYWMLTLSGQPRLAEHAQHCQDTLRPLGLDNISADGFHLTLARIGPVQDVSDSRLEAMAAAATPNLPAAFDLQAIPLTASRGAVRYSVAPWTPVLDLHACLSAINHDHGVPHTTSTALLRPHVGIAYCNRPIPAHTVREVISPLRELPPVTLPVWTVSLVELRRDVPRYEWETVHEFTLMNGTGPRRSLVSS